MSLCSIKHYTMKTYVGDDVQINIFLTLALVEGERSASCPSCFTPRKRTGLAPEMV
jgi:hypothetical protein